MRASSGGPMAKRGAEALWCRAPGCESFVSAAPLLKRLRGDPERKGPRGGGLKRKRASAEGGGGEEEEAGPARAKRRSVSEDEPRLPRGAPRGDRTPKPPEEPEDDAWRYNSFQYWRSPLPAIDLSDILDLEKADTIDARQSSSACLSEMET